MALYSGEGQDIQQSLDGISSFAIYNSAAIQVVWRNFYDDSVTRNDTDEMLPHFPGDMGHYNMAVFKLNAKLGIRKGFDNFTFNLNCFFFRHAVVAFSFLFLCLWLVMSDVPTLTC